MKIKTTLLLFTTIAVSQSSAAIIFDFRDTGNTTAIESGTVLISGLTATLSANSGVLNQTASSFGINATGSGDATALIDDGAGIAEIFSVQFDQDVILNSATLSLFSAGETANFTFGATTIGITDTGSGSDVFNAPANTVLTTGQSISIAWTAGNGFSVDSLSVDLVPEPSSTLLLGLGSLALFTRRRR